MARRKRLLLFLALALACGLGLWAWQTYGVPVPTSTRYEQIASGMTLAQVRRIAGGAGEEGKPANPKRITSILTQPYGRTDPKTDEIYHWQFEDGIIVVTFDAQGGVNQKALWKR